jgi:hypothetical protein
MHTLLREIIQKYASKKPKLKSEKATYVGEEIHKKIMEKLAPNTYKDKDSGNDILFTTAYSRQHAKAVEDYNKELDNSKEGEGESKKTRKNTKTLQSEADASTTKKKKQQDSLDEIKKTKDQFRLDLYDDPQKFINNLLGGEREKAIHIQYAHEVAKDLAKSFDEVAKNEEQRLNRENSAEAKKNKMKKEEGKITEDKFKELEKERKAKHKQRIEEVETLEKVLGLDTSKFTPTEREKKENVAQADENKRKLKDGEISKNDFTRLEQRRKAKQQLRKKERKKEIVRAIGKLKKTSFPSELNEGVDKIVINDLDVMKDLGLIEFEGDLKDLSDEEVQDLNDSFKEKLDGMSKEEKKEAKNSISKKKKESLADKADALIAANTDRVLKGGTEKDREIMENNPVLKLMSSFRKTVSREEASDQKTKLNERQQKQLRTDFLENMVSSLGGSYGFGSASSISGSDMDSKVFISKMIMKVDIDKLSAEDMDKVSEGFKEASVRLQKILDGNEDPDAGLLEKLNQLQENINDIFDEQINSKEGAELGASILAGAMEMAITRNPLFGVDTSSSSVFIVKKDSMGREMKEVDEDLLNDNSRFSARKYNGRGESETRLALENVESKMKALEKKGERGSAEYESLGSVKDGIEVSLLLQDVRPRPKGLAKPFDYLVEIAKQTNLDSAYDALKYLKSEDLKDLDKHEIQTKFLHSLPDKELAQALGGESGPFGDALDIIQELKCPNIPINGDMAGEVIGPGDVCPYPVDPGTKQSVRNHVIQMMSDHHVVNPTQALGSSSYGSKKRKEEKQDKQEAKKHEKMKQLFEISPEKFEKILTSGSENEKEESLAYLIYQMRVKQLEEMNFGSYNSKKNKNQNEKKRDVAKRDAILEMVKKNKKDEIKEMLQDLDKAMKADLSWDSSFGKQASQSVGSAIFNSLFIRGRYLDRVGGFTPMDKKSRQPYNYQEVATSFEVGMRAFPFFKGDAKTSGVVVAVFPAIGMVDLKFPYGVTRFPVEDLVLDTSEDVEDVSTYENPAKYYPVSAGKQKPSKEKVASMYLSLRHKRK